ncbi:MAG: N-acetylmuramoyl-L-alanine amidase family protein [Candidatus Aminicenantales bacterium]
MSRKEDFIRSALSLFMIFVGAAFLFFIPFFLAGQTGGVVEVRVRDEADSTLVVIQANLPLDVNFNKLSQTLEVRLASARPLRFRSQPFRSRLVSSLGWASTKSGYIIAIENFIPAFRYETNLTRQPFRVEIRLWPLAKEEPKAADSGLTGHPPRSTEKAAEKPIQSKEIIEKLDKREEQAAGLNPEAAKRIKTVVIDPGHGGLETGARGPGGTLEKDITLAIGLKLKKIIERNLALRVILTRDKDTDISLENRAALANNSRADLFISIHANGAFRPKAHGSETYFLSLKASDEEARRLAYFENNSPEFEAKIEEETQNQIRLILWDMAQAAFLKQSSQLAEIIQAELNNLLGTANRGIKQAPFKVLTGVACPAVLVEVAFISNPEEEAQLKNESFQESVAQALYQGVLSYLRKFQ